MKFLIALFSFLTAILIESAAQVPGKNLVINGNFEKGNRHFASEFEHSNYSLGPGQYAITAEAASLNEDMVNPKGGDHTSGDGYYMVINSDNTPGKRVWCTKVNVIPNSMYTFTVYFCNLYRHRPTNWGFQINGMQVGGYPKGNETKVKLLVNNKQVGEIEKDLFQMFGWIKATATWYSGTTWGNAEICIENPNYNASGNDLALDDIEFTFNETMPPGYKPKLKETIITSEPRQVENKKEPEKVSMLTFKEIYSKGDSIAPGVYVINKKNKNIGTSASAYKGQKIKLSNLIFEKGKPDLLPEATQELDQLAHWLKENPKVRIRLEGHTDNQGDPALNLKLSQERVVNAQQYLINQGIEQNRIDLIGYGGMLPIADNSKEETRKLNRRVEFVIIGD